MGENTKIEWCTHTFNPWVGCTKISHACDNCYAEGWAKRTGQTHLWAGERRRTAGAYWRAPLKWNKVAEGLSTRDRVFCASLADVFDNQVPNDWRTDLWALVARTPSLDWLLLTKRPQNIAKMLPGSCVEQLVGRDLPWPWPHVWLGATVEDRASLRRVDHLRAVPARIRFLSIEPLLGDLGMINLSGIHLVIVGGESGPYARPMDEAWANDLLRQCRAAGVKFFMKQMTKKVPIPDHLMVREMPDAI